MGCRRCKALTPTAQLQSTLGQIQWVIKSVRKVYTSLKSDKNEGCFLEGLCIFMVISRSVLLRMGNTRVVPKVMSNIFLHANWEQQKKESAVVDGTSCCVILGCLVTSIACIT